MDNFLNNQTKVHWTQLRQMTYDFISEISDTELNMTLPFPQSQSIANQLYCMLGTTETFGNYLKTGKWSEWNCSLDNWERTTIDEITSKFKSSDELLIEGLDQRDLTQAYNSGKTLLQLYFILVEHESHHQGQIINFIYALNLPIPKSWQEKWALVREEE